MEADVQGCRATENLLREYAANRSARLRAEIIERQSDLVRSVAGKFVRRGASLEDLVQCAWLALIRALDRYEPSRNTRFTTYAVHCMVGEIKRYFRDQTWSLKVPRRLQEIAVGLDRLQGALTARLRREPTVAEMASAAGVTEEDLVEAMELRQAYHLYRLDERRQGLDGRESESVGELLGGPDPAIQSVVDDLAAEHMLRGLAERDRQIVRRRFLQGCTQQEVAAELGLSQMHISRLERRALRRLRDEWFPS